MLKFLLYTLFCILSADAVAQTAKTEMYDLVKKLLDDSTGYENVGDWAVKIPVIGIGGIRSAEDALEFLLVGAKAIEVGTANFLDPEATVKIIRGLETYCQRKKIESIAALIGSLQIYEN